MNCPACEHEDNHVLRTRSDKDRVLRTRKCGACRHTWTTEELLSARAGLMRKAVDVVNSLTTLNQELDHGQT